MKENFETYSGGQDSDTNLLSGYLYFVTVIEKNLIKHKEHASY
jgi:hypothetical protein